jgi:hypothetical protein
MNFVVKLFQCFFCWRIKPDSDRELANADVIIGQSFGLRKRNPGKSNEAMADIARKLHDQYNLPLVLQWEIANCLPNLPKDFVVREHHIKGEYLDTYESLYQQRVFCQTKGWTKAIMIAHSDHYWRCMMVAERLGFYVIAVDTSSVPYDKLSTQSWTRSMARFLPREILARIVYLFTKKI